MSEFDMRILCIDTVEKSLHTELGRCRPRVFNIHIDIVKQDDASFRKLGQPGMLFIVCRLDGFKT